MESFQSLRNVAYAQLQSYIGQLSAFEKEAYLTALRLAPHLVLTESDPLRFLQHMNYNAAPAGRALVAYWRLRRELFGDRAFLPLISTPPQPQGGALNQDDIEYIQSGAAVFLPNDAAGRTVVCFDWSRRLQESRDVRLRAAFYYGQVISENDLSAANAYVELVIVSDPDKYDSIVEECREIIHQIFPIKTKVCHYFNCIPAWIPVRFSDFMSLLVERTPKHYQVYIHATKQKRDIVQSLNAHGLSEDGIPGCIGGTWGYEQWLHWLSDRARQDRIRYPQCFLSIQPVKDVSTDTSLISAVRSDLMRPRLDDQHNRILRLAAPDLGSLLHPEPTDSFYTDNPGPRAQPFARSDQTNSIPNRQEDGNTSAQHVGDDSKPAAVEGSTDTALVSIDWRTQLDKAIQLLSETESAAYVEALRVARAEIWGEEAIHNSFLAVEYLNAWFAAKRLTRYWQLRSALFGGKRFHSLYQTGEHALGRGDLAVLQSGFVVLLPNDTHHSSVLYIDPSKIDNATLVESRDRCIFYMFSILTENETSQQEGAVLLYKVESPPFDRLDISFLARLVHALPLRLKAIHLLSHEHVPGGIERQITFAENSYLHVGNRDELLNKLSVFGLKKACLPRFVNGEWGYERFFQWQEIRTRMEWKLPLGLSWNHTDEDFPTMKTYVMIPENDKAERKRRLNVIHCRRKRNRQVLDTMALQERYDELRDERAALVHENRRLEELVRIANAMVYNVEDESARLHSK